MKNRTAFFALALCLISSLSLAESAVDAPLVVSDPYATAQPDQSTTKAKRHSDKKKNKQCASQQAAQTKDKNQQPYGGAPSKTGTAPSL